MVNLLSIIRFVQTMIFEPHSPDKCCLCGTSDHLTGEHKIKASVLKAVFSDDDMVIFNSASVSDPRKYAQGPKSRAFHFTAGICAECNASRTQSADREFDHFHALACQLTSENKDPGVLFQSKRYLKGSSHYLNFFRYFAKLLCCHLGSSGAPRPVDLSRFAVGESNRNRVWVRIDQDQMYQKVKSMVGPLPYAAHGGLMVFGDRRNNNPIGFQSTLSFGALCYIFSFNLTWWERYALKFGHNEFYDWCHNRIVDSRVSATSIVK